MSLWCETRMARVDKTAATISCRPQGMPEAENLMQGSIRVPCRRAICRTLCELGRLHCVVLFVLSVIFRNLPQATKERLEDAYKQLKTIFRVVRDRLCGMTDRHRWVILCSLAMKRKRATSAACTIAMHHPWQLGWAS